MRFGEGIVAVAFGVALAMIVIRVVLMLGWL